MCQSLTGLNISAPCLHSLHFVNLVFSEWSDWISFCESAAAALWTKGVDWLVAVEGTNWDCDVVNCAWGENLEGVRNFGRTFDLDSFGSDRFIWSPHVYGEDVTGNGAYSEEVRLIDYMSIRNSRENEAN